MMVRSTIILWMIWWVAVQACRTVRLQSIAADLDMTLTQVAIDEQAESPDLKEFAENGRPMYQFVANLSPSDVDIYYLFHEKTSDPTGTGRWVLASYRLDNKRPFRKFHLTFHALVESWAILPHLIDDISDSNASRSPWQIRLPTNKRWTADPAFQVQCYSLENEEDDSALFFESSVKHQHHLTGFYVRRYLSDHFISPNEVTNVYTKIKIYPEDSLFSLYDISIHSDEENDIIRHWIISNERVGSEAGIVYAADNSANADLIPDEAVWNFIGKISENQSAPGGWIFDESARVLSVRKYYMNLRNSDFESFTSQKKLSIMKVLREIRRLKPHPANPMQQVLSNGVGIPRIGLGTGGISHEDCERVFTEAIDMGYQLFDMAREYGNEHILGHVATYQKDHDPRAIRKMRQQLFYETKVWPTNLGFEPTIHEVLASLGDLRTHHIDLYLLHWSKCDTNIDWMHCDDVVDPQGTWQQSWKALEKLYAEGYLQTIGVSNFNVDQLQQLETKVATILPHAVQNYASIEHLDTDVRMWCSLRGIAYQPYATVRNIQFMNSDHRSLLKRIVADHATHGVNEHAVMLKYFLQTGACIIPRATKEEHLQKNLQLWSWGLTTQELADIGWDAEKFHSLHQEHYSAVAAHEDL